MSVESIDAVQERPPPPRASMEQSSTRSLLRSLPSDRRSRDHQTLLVDGDEDTCDLVVLVDLTVIASRLLFDYRMMEWDASTSASMSASTLFVLHFSGAWRSDVL